MRSTVTLITYSAGNVRSAINAIEACGFAVKEAKTEDDIDNAEVSPIHLDSHLKYQIIIFPGVGSFSSVMESLEEQRFIEPLRRYISQDRPFLGICVGLQCLFEFSQESPGVKGMGVIPGKVRRFSEKKKPVPHIGWNLCAVQCENQSWIQDSSHYYFVHSYGFFLDDAAAAKEWVCSLTTYGSETFVSAVRRGNVFATQFHPEKSGRAGLDLIQSFLDQSAGPYLPPVQLVTPKNGLTRRIIACLDVRSNEANEIIVTKGDQYDVREKDSSRKIRDFGTPSDVAGFYYERGADEVALLNITQFRSCPLKDLPMLHVLREVSRKVFIPLTIGGGIRDITEPDGNVVAAIDVVSEYFNSGADKVSIGSDAVYAVERYLKEGTLSGASTIEQISKRYGKQAVVISVDPKRVFVASPSDTTHNTIKTDGALGPNGEQYCWYQCTVKGGREARDIDVIQLVTSCEKMGAGEILLNCIDRDGTNAGYDIELINHVRRSVGIPVIASSGAGNADHFKEVFCRTDAEAALAAGIFHRREVDIMDLKRELILNGCKIRD